MKIRLFKLIVALTLLIILTVLIAFPIFAAGYYINIAVTESAGTSYTKLPIIASVNNTYLASSGFISSTGLDTRIANSANISVPHLVVDDKVVFVDNLTASSTSSYQYRSGYSALASFPIVAGYGGYVTTADNATLEPNDNFILEMGVYLQNTGTVFNKQDALRLEYNATTRVLTLTAGNYSSPDITLTASNVTQGLHTIKANITYAPSEESLILVPDGAGDYEGENNENPGIAHWSIFASPTQIQGDTMDFGESWVGANPNDLYSFPYPDVGFSSVIVNLYGVGNYPDSTVGIIVKMPGYSEYRSPTSDPYGLGYPTIGKKIFPLATNPVTSLPWQRADFENIQFGLFGSRYTGTIAYTGYEVELVDVYNIPTLSLFVDNMSTAVDSEEMTVAIPDNSNNWVWYPDPYFNYIKLETGN